MYRGASGIAMREPSWYADRAAIASNQSFDESKGVQDRALSRMGINPNSGRFAGMQTKWGLARAAAEAAAKTKATQDAEETAFRRQTELMNASQRGQGMGAGMMENAGQMYGRAAGIYGDLGKSYDTLAGDAAKNEQMRRGPNTRDLNKSNDMQAEIDEMLSGYIPSAWNNRLKPRTGIVGPYVL